MTTVREHTRRPPEKPADPFKPVMEARKAYYARKHGVELVDTDDARLSRPVADPAPGGKSLATIIEDIRDLVKVWKRIGE
jgi:hypothetical protein